MIHLQILELEASCCCRRSETKKNYLENKVKCNSEIEVALRKQIVVLESKL